ncbi:MAG: hypothetical protein IPP77_08530 [Bacteroidetes bacterium]|nr:hypothetical protein [Bacteroidota bacterium]
MIESAIGDRNKEEAISIDFKEGTGEVHYGRGNLKNQETTITQNSHTCKFIFCSYCEDALGKLESKFKALLVEKIRQEKYKGQFTIKELTKELALYEWKYDASGFYTFLLSVVWRLCLRIKIEEQMDVLPQIHFETMRKKLCKDLNACLDDNCDCRVGFTLLTHFEVDNKRVISAFHKKLNPEVFLLNDFVVLTHFETESKTDPKTFARMSNLPEMVLNDACINREDDKAKILIGNESKWKDFYDYYFKAQLSMYPVENILSAMGQVNDKLADPI